MDDFARAGSTPTVGQGANNVRSRYSEAALRNLPGSAGVVRGRLDEQADEIGAGVEKIASKLSAAQGGERAGRAVVEGITGPSGFMKRFKAQSNQLYDEVERQLPPGTAVAPSSTQQVLAELTTPIQGAANTSGLLLNSKVAGIAKAFGDDLAANGGTMPYEAMKRLRTQLGEVIGDSVLSPDAPTRQLRRLYGSLSDDMTAAAVATGNPRAIQAASRANNYYRAGMKRVDDIERVIDKNGGFEKVYSALYSSGKEGGTTLRKVMSSLDGQAQRDLAATTLRRLGKANPSAQDDVGELFNPETYLTNWNRLAPEAKRALFDRFEAATLPAGTAVLMFDIDHFKAYNDHYGHVGGDHCLQQVAAALATATQRQGELVARYGGEEFAVLLPDADSAQARVTAQRLCATVRALALEHLTSPVRHCVTISVGATCLYPENSAPAQGIALLFEQADAALYQAKNTGRDRAVLWAEQPQDATAPGP